MYNPGEARTDRSDVDREQLEGGHAPEDSRQIEEERDSHDSDGQTTEKVSEPSMGSDDDCYPLPDQLSTGRRNRPVTGVGVIAIDRLKAR